MYGCFKLAGSLVPRLSTNISWCVRLLAFNRKASEASIIDSRGTAVVTQAQCISQKHGNGRKQATNYEKAKVRNCTGSIGLSTLLGVYPLDSSVSCSSLTSACCCSSFQVPRRLISAVPVQVPPFYNSSSSLEAQGKWVRRIKPLAHFQSFSTTANSITKHWLVRPVASSFNQSYGICST